MSTHPGNRRRREEEEEEEEEEKRSRKRTGGRARLMSRQEMQAQALLSWRVQLGNSEHGAGNVNSHRSAE
ncbi:hypothetical protein EYF80_034435 [Liparis tanakae]|uniref:Uncharacterized protein n=1 Tax=Liparis tanakae TaxID=230148 RepID=A0A4Z2GRM4_9TELE|nr:hypothetical protein EYF80_034435 [Liparis tanakae]